MRTLGILVASVLLWAGCDTSNDEAVRAAQTMGFSDVRVHDSTAFWPEWYGCGKDDTFAYEASAKNPRGEPVRIVICMGLWFKGATVRVK